MQERADQITRIGDVIRVIWSAMVCVGGDSFTQGIKSMSFHHFFPHKKQLAPLWEQKWCSMKQDQTSKAEIDR